MRKEIKMTEITQKAIDKPTETGWYYFSVTKRDYDFDSGFYFVDIHHKDNRIVKVGVAHWYGLEGFKGLWYKAIIPK